MSVMSNGTNERRPAENPVVVYDVTREAANRVVDFYASQATIGGADNPAVIAISDIYAEVKAIDARDREAQHAATESFRARYAELRAQRPPLR